MFDVVDKKEVFMDYKNDFLRQLKNLHFPMGKDSQDLVKNLKILSNLFLFHKGLDIMVDGILDKEVFLNYKIVTMRVEILAFF